MNKSYNILNHINKWPLFYTDYNLRQYENIIKTRSTLSWMNIIEPNKLLNDDLENNYLSQMAYMHSRSYLIGTTINEYEQLYNEEDDFLNNMSFSHSRCEKHS
jgi:hypothetical protein